VTRNEFVIQYINDVAVKIEIEAILDELIYYYILNWIL